MSSEALSPRQEFKRGWLVLFACFCGIGAGIASINYYTAGIFIVPIEKEFGWSRAAISAQSMFGVLILVLGSPFLGRLIDKIGVRKVAVQSLACYSISLYVASYLVVSLWSFYLLTIITSLVAIGSSSITFTRVVTVWFDSARGLALGISLMGGGLIAAIAPALLTDYVTEFGWRSGYRALSVVILAATIIVWLFIKDDPDPQNETENQSSLDKTGFTFDQAIRSRLFFTLAFIFILVALALSGFVVHFIPMLLELGLSADDAGKTAAVMGISVMLGRIVTGFLIDRFHAPKVAAILFAFSAIGFLTFLTGGVEFAVLVAIAVGISMGAEVDLIGYLVSRYFGLKAYGSIYGSLFSIFLIGASTSPLIAGYVFDVTSSYSLVISAAVVALIVAAVLLLTLKPFPSEFS